MSELVTTAAEGTLYWLSQAELGRIRRLAVDVLRRTALLADACRLNALYMTTRAGATRIPSSLSSLDIVTWLHENELAREDSRRDVYFASQGHDAFGLYAVLIALERVPFSELHRLRQSEAGATHADLGVAGISTNSGSLGMGISKAKGMVLADRLRGLARRVFVMTSEAELLEGQIWESLLSAVNLGLHEIIAIIENHRAGPEPATNGAVGLSDLTAKFGAFGWHVERLSGSDLGAFERALNSVRGVKSPKVIIADTLKSWCVPAQEVSTEAGPAAHAQAAELPYRSIANQLIIRLNRRCDELSVQRLAFDTLRTPKRGAAPPLQRLLGAYSAALVREMGHLPEVVALDADFAEDTGQCAARAAFPARAVECGAAEMDMVSMAGGLAANGMLPVCHSLAYLMSMRANEQLYDNATEHLHIVYVASHAGVLPGGSGHSNQSVRDIAAVATIPDLVALAPSCEAEVGKALEWCLREHRFGCWLRLESVPWAVPFELPAEHQLELGVGNLLRPGTDALFIGYGPVLLTEAFVAAERLEESGLSVAVVNLPWLNRVHAPWLSHTVSGFAHVFSLDNHHLIGGQGDRIAEVMARAGFARWPRLHRCGIENIPARGTDAEILKHHGLDAASLHERVLGALRDGRAARQK